MRSVIQSLLTKHSCLDVRVRARYLFVGIILSQACSSANNFQKQKPTIGTSKGSATVQSGESTVYHGDQAVQPTSPVMAPAANPAAVDAATIENEAATAPTPVTGAYLHCAKILDASAIRMTSVLGCRLQNAQGAKIVRAAGQVYNFEVQPLSYATLQIKAQVPTANYDYQVEFSATTVEAANRALLEAQVSLVVQDALNRELGRFSGLASALNRGNESNLKGGWDRPNADPVFQDLYTKLYWYYDDQQGRNWAEATVHCQRVPIQFGTGWRFPSIEEMRIAVDNGLGSMFNDAQSMATKDSPNNYYWTDSFAPVPGQPGVTGAYVMPLNGANFGQYFVTTSNVGDQAGILCVRGAP